MLNANSPAIKPDKKGAIMRIAQLSNHYFPCTGGIEGFVQQLAENLNKKGIQCSELCLNKCWDSKNVLKEKEVINGVTVNRMPFLNLRWYKIPKGLLGKIIGFDLVHIHSPGFFIDLLALTKWLHKKKLVVSTHGGIFHSKQLGLLKKAYFHIWWRLLFKAIDFVICDSQHDFELFSKIAPRGKITLIENAVPVEKFLRLEKQKKKNTFLFVGRLSRNKRIDLLIESFAKIAEKEKDSRLQIIGRDFEQLLPELKEKVRQHGLQGNIVFKGEVSEAQLMSAYDESQFFISASAYEGFGIAIIEAMAAGAIPVLNNIATFNAFVEDGRNGFILDFENTEKAAEKILAIMQLGEKEKEKLGQNCRARSNDFSWQGKIDEYIEVYNKVLGSRT